MTIWRFAAACAATGGTRGPMHWSPRRPADELHERRLHTATSCYAADLDPARCRFGLRRLTLEGTLEAPDVAAAAAKAALLLAWTLLTVYGDTRYDALGPLSRLERARISVTEVSS